ncbi:MAG: PAS domain-containing protein [Candidatus Jettenia sp.]|nr:PAS domain-containing protein [Candidatus Jettenia sp.]
MLLSHVSKFFITIPIFAFHKKNWFCAEWLYKQFIPFAHLNDRLIAPKLMHCVQQSVVGFWSIVRNIIRRKHAKKTLRASESKYRLLFESLPQRIFSKDKNFVYMSCNENLARDLHIRPDEITGKTDYDFFPKELAEKYRTEDKRVIESGQTDDREEKYIIDGQELIVRMVRTPIKDEKGNVLGILGAFLDITEKITLQREAERSRHLASLGELAAGVAHEINNPITGVINCAQILFNKSSEGSKERDIASRIIKEANRIANITSSLLSFARFGDSKEKKSIVSIREIVANTFVLIKAQLRKEGITIKLDVSPKLPQIIAHPQQIQQVFLNAISNARYALNQKYPEAHDNKILEIIGEETTIDNRPAVKITFYDHGTGIPAMIRDRVVEPFYTTKPRSKGTGLGLSISYSIIKDHEGRLIIDSVEGVFTKVIIVLPAFKPT